ncbi:MAG: hypothetical protein RMJ98_20985, partial [Myxococcales bacterium]|nr:hypothetical protein [Polyangiaceae bacterium]MDW8251779.1 hypothetical protein [Myxococcales bacterium]
KAGLLIPPTLDDVIEDAFVKNPMGRISSVGELASRIGKAFGLQGDFRQWSSTPVDQLEAQIAAALPALMTQGSVPSAGVISDPFGSPAMTMQSARSALDDAFRQGTPPVEVLDTLPLKKGPPVALLVGIGAFFLLIGAVAAFLLKY